MSNFLRMAQLGSSKLGPLSFSLCPSFCLRDPEQSAGKPSQSQGTRLAGCLCGTSLLLLVPYCYSRQVKPAQRPSKPQPLLWPCPGESGQACPGRYPPRPPRGRLRVFGRTSKLVTKWERSGAGRESWSESLPLSFSDVGT